MIKHAKDWPSALEKFGIFFLGKFHNPKLQSTHLFSDEVLDKKVNTIVFYSIIASALIGAICVLPMVLVDLKFANSNLITHYSYNALCIGGFTAIELFILFLIALYAVYRLACLVPFNDNKVYMTKGPFHLKNILARTALEINEPIVELFGIDPFKQISKNNLLIIGLFYKLKIFLTNQILKWSLFFLVGEKLFGIPITYEAIPVEIFWNAVIIYKVLKEARLRIFGFYIANSIADKPYTTVLINKMSNVGQECCIRAIANMVVMTKNYHPNMMILFFEFYEKVTIQNVENLDDWNLFISKIKTLSNEEKNIVWDILSISIAFDGKLSNLEKEHLLDVYGNYQLQYLQRINALIYALQNGRITEAFKYCWIDYNEG